MKKWSDLPKEIHAILLTIVTVVIVGSFGWLFRRVQRQTQSLSGYLASIPDYSYVNARINGRQFRLEVVNSERSITQGLSDREAIGSDGMLFVLPTKGTYPFWMPRMHFDLDILWLDEDEIIDITPDVPAQPNVPTTQLPLYTSSRPVNLVLEIPAGRAALLSIHVGDHLEITRK